jgi:hypothetical protein
MAREKCSTASSSFPISRYDSPARPPARCERARSICGARMGTRALPAGTPAWRERAPRWVWYNSDARRPAGAHGRGRDCVGRERGGGCERTEVVVRLGPRRLLSHVRSDTCHSHVRSDTCHSHVRSDTCHFHVRSFTCPPKPPHPPTLNGPESQSRNELKPRYFQGRDPSTAPGWALASSSTAALRSVMDSATRPILRRQLPRLNSGRYLKAPRRQMTSRGG